MAKQPTGIAPDDDFSFDDIKLDGVGLDDQALFADLDNEMKLDEEPAGPGKKPAAAAGKPAAGKTPAASAGKPAGKPAAKPAADDLMDLDLDVTDAEAPDKPGADGLSLDLDLGDAGKSDELDLDLGSGEKDAFDLDIQDVSGGTPSDDIFEAPDVELTAGAEASSDSDLKLDGDLDLNLDGVKSTGGDLEIEGLDLNLDEAMTPAEPATSASAAEDEVTLDLDGEKEGPAEDLTPAADLDLQGLDLNLDLDSDQPLDTRLAEPLKESAPAQPKEDAVLDVQSLPGARVGESAVEEQTFEAVPDVNLDELDLTLDMPVAEHEAPVEAPSPQPARMVRAQPEPAPFVAVPDTKMPPGEVMELNLSDLDETPAPAARTAAPPVVSATGSILLTVPHQIQVRIGTVSLLGREILDLSYGSVVQLNRSAGEPVDLMLEGNRIAQGEIVLINGRNIGVRIVALGG